MADRDIRGVVTLLSGVTDDVTSDTLEARVNGIRGMYGVAQASGIETATVSLQGRLGPSYGWVTIKQFTTDDAVEVVLFPQMRAVVSGYSAGTIYLGLISDPR